MATDGKVRRTQGQRRADSEHALVTAAAELIAERGIDGASLASIGERAGTSRGLPNHHFGSKDALVERVARQAQDHISRTMIDSFGGQQGFEEATSLERIHATIDTYLRLFEKPTAEVRALIVIWGSTFPSTASGTGLIAADRRSIDGWTEMIGHGQQDGSIRTDVDPPSEAVVILGLMRGVAALRLTEGARTDMTQVRETCQAWVHSALAPAEKTVKAPKPAPRRRRAARAPLPAPS